MTGARQAAGHLMRCEVQFRRALWSPRVHSSSSSSASAVNKGRPWTGIEVLPQSLVKPTRQHNAVQVTGLWGWTAIPNAIKLATIVQAARYLARRESARGPLERKQVGRSSAIGGSLAVPRSTRNAYSGCWVVTWWP